MATATNTVTHLYDSMTTQRLSFATSKPQAYQRKRLALSPIAVTEQPMVLIRSANPHRVPRPAPPSDQCLAREPVCLPGSVSWRYLELVRLWLRLAAATAAGAVAGLAAGSIVGSLTDLESARTMRTSTRKGSIVAAHWCRSGRKLPRSTVTEIMGKYGPVDPEQRREDYRRDGWNRFEDRVDNLSQPDRTIR